MKIVDTNVLLYAVDATTRFHTQANHWLRIALAGNETVAFPWVSLLGFIRIGTNPRIMTTPLTVAQAHQLVTGWLAQPTAVSLNPARDHPETLFRLLDQSGTAGNFTTDAHIAALAIENRAEVVTFDRDFARFGVRTVIPDSPA